MKRISLFIIVFFLIITSVYIVWTREPHHNCLADTLRDNPAVERITTIEPPTPPEARSAAILSEGTNVAGKYDFTDSSSWNLTVSAWECLAAKDYDGVAAYAAKCQELYEQKAKEMAQSMRSFASMGHEDENSVINDVATSHYVVGEAYMRRGMNVEAAGEFNYIISNYPYAQCWDPKGWFWKVAEISKKNLEKMASPQKDEAGAGN